MLTVRQIPNILSISRIFLAFAFPFVDPSLRLMVVIVALLTEFFDGYLARRLNAVTLLGQALDPIADKLFVLATVIVLIVEQRLSWFHFTLVAMRDITVAIGTISVMFESQGEALRSLKPRLSGKLTTALQFAFLVSLYARWPFVRPLFIITAVISSLSALDYLYHVLHNRFDQRSGSAHF